MDAFKPTGIGAVAAMHVIKWVFSQALSAPPKLKAWDNYLMTTTLHRIFTGTTVNGSKPMIGAIGCSVAPAASWWPTTLTIAAAVNIASLLKGDEGFCRLSAAALEAGETVYANINFKFPSDAEESDTYSGVLAIEYEYTGSPPDPAAYGNDGGTEGSPSWTALLMGIKGYTPDPGIIEIRPCNAGEGPNGTGTWFLTFPTSGQEHPDEIWLKEYEA